jgi:ADP-dependent NAD(P)H-hydrate dehydratase / NAD(P)H-hydrate epimerase
MPEILTAQAMRAAETAAIESGAIPARVLMERAGEGVVMALLAEWPEFTQTPPQTLVLCGPGNNGGDGFVVARLLHQRGWPVTVHLHAPDISSLPPVAAHNARLWQALGPMDGLGASVAPAPDLVIDALFGIGLNRALDVTAAAALGAHNAPKTRRLALDIPSGLNANTGRLFEASPPGIPLPAHLTVTFHCAKPGHYLAAGPSLCGKLRVMDIGLPATGSALSYVSPPFPGLAKSGNGHKFTYGHALVLSGGAGRTGAARLAARGALRIGAGLVTLGVPPSAQQEAASQVTAIMLTRIANAKALTQTLADPRFTALCIGPGFGLGAREADLLAVALASRRPLVIDADALTLLTDPALFAQLHPNCLLTPHHGEFSRLFPDLAEALTQPGTSKIDITCAAARRAQTTVLFKGSDTVIATADGRAALHASAYARAAPWLATAGAGDVLAGFAAGLMARGMLPFEAAQAAAWLHAETARDFGAGLIAEDIPDHLPKILAQLGV